MTATRENTGSANSDGGQQGPLFSLPNGESASFLLHNFENADITRHIIGHGGRVTDDDSAADVILTIRPDEYKYLKDKYAISRKTHVRMSGFVDRCINSRRFQLAPVVEKGVPGRRIKSRRTEFTEEDDEYLCQYIAGVLPDNAEGGRTGHFIYADLIRRADEFSQYTWAHRHPKDGWRERYRKNQERLDNRIAEIVEGNPPAPDGKGRYKYRRYGKIDQDAELIAGNDDLVELGAEEGGDSATDDEGGTVQTKRLNAQPQEEEEEDEGHLIVHQPGASPNPRNQDAESPEEAEEQTTGPEPETGPRTRAATRRGVVSPREARTPKRRRTKRAQQVVEARPIVRPLSPRRTRAGSKVRSVNPHDAALAVSQTTSREKAKSKTSATVAVTVPQSIHESRVSDEFVAYSDDEGDMHEVDANLQVSTVSLGIMQGGSLADTQTHSPGTDDLQTSRRLQTTLLDDAAVADPDGSGDDTDAELFALVRRLDATAQPPPGPKASLSKGDDDLDRTPSESGFPSLGTRASAEKRRRTQAAKVMPYVPPRGTRAASMMEHERA